MTWMKHIDRIEANGIGTGLHMAGRRLHRGIHRVIGSVSSHVRHNVSSTAVAKRNDVPARDLTALTVLGVGLVTANALRSGCERGSRPDAAAECVLRSPRRDDDRLPAAHEHRQSALRPRPRRAAVTLGGTPRMERPALPAGIRSPQLSNPRSAECPGSPCIRRKTGCHHKSAPASSLRPRSPPWRQLRRADVPLQGRPRARTRRPAPGRPRSPRPAYAAHRAP